MLPKFNAGGPNGLRMLACPCATAVQTAGFPWPRWKGRVVSLPIPQFCAAADHFSTKQWRSMVGFEIHWMLALWSCDLVPFRSAYRYCYPSDLVFSAIIWPQKSIRWSVYLSSYLSTSHSLSLSLSGPGHLLNLSIFQPFNPSINLTIWCLWPNLSNPINYVNIQPYVVKLCAILTMSKIAS